MLMAMLVLALSLFSPLHETPIAKKGFDAESTISGVSYSDIPDLTPTPEPLPKLSVLFFALPKFWAIVMAVLAPEIREYRATYKQLFIRNIQFVFVSTLAP